MSLLMFLLSCGMPSERCLDCTCEQVTLSPYGNIESCDSITKCKSGRGKSWLEVAETTYPCKEGDDTKCVIKATNDACDNTLLVCNDETLSPTCTSCSPGCCAYHGGCL